MSDEGRAGVLLVDDHALIRDGLRRALDRTPDLAVTGEAASLEEARSRLRTGSYDALVVDVRLGDGNGLDLVREVRRSNAVRAIVVLSMYAGDQNTLAAREAGASSFVPKDAPSSVVVEALRGALDYPMAFHAPDSTHMGAVPRDRHRGILTDREHEVLVLLAEGLGVSGVSRRLYISESTAKTHISNIYTKLGAANRAQALMAALREGLIEPM